VTDLVPPRQDGEPAAPGDSSPEVLTLLRQGEITVEGRLLDASNATLYCTITHQDLRAACVYKPVRGERPLWDFPDGTLAGREAAAYLMSQATGWNIVPPTVLRDGPFGPGMVQLWINADTSVDPRRLVRAGGTPLRRMAVFDAVINNADRKGVHLIPLPGGHVYGVDHGVCFAAEPKLRTVLWGWAGQALTDEAIDMLSRLRAHLEGALARSLADLLTTREINATIARVEALLSRRRHPEPSGEWPAVPWPPF
jgi:conserved hypothetical protein